MSSKNHNISTIKWALLELPLSKKRLRKNWPVVIKFWGHTYSHVYHHGKMYKYWLIKRQSASLSSAVIGYGNNWPVCITRGSDFNMHIPVPSTIHIYDKVCSSKSVSFLVSSQNSNLSGTYHFVVWMFQSWNVGI